MEMELKKKVALKKLNRSFMWLKWIKAEMIAHDGKLGAEHYTDMVFRLETVMHDIEDSAKALQHEIEFGA